MADEVFLMWSIEQDAWRARSDRGYTRVLAEAGRYRQDEAGQILKRSNRVAVTECAIPLGCLLTIEKHPDV